MTPPTPAQALPVPHETPLVVLAEGCFGDQRSKTATGVIRYGNWPIVAVIDSTQTGRTVRDVTGLDCDAPIINTLAQVFEGLPASAETRALTPKALLIGIAPPGGDLPDAWRPVVEEALKRGLHVVSGLHHFLGDDPVFAALANSRGLIIWDVRNPACYGLDKQHPIVKQAPRPPETQVITLVGSDCSVGKMVTALELHRAASQRGKASQFLATGQTGILIAGQGLPLDRLIGDFMAGTVEQAVDQLIDDHAPDYVFVEGQGSLLHPSYSGVTLSLLHGSRPDALILCHRADLTTIRGGYALPIPPLYNLVRLYEQAASWVFNAHARTPRVVGIAVNTAALADGEAQVYLRSVVDRTGLPATDPVRFGVQSLLDALDASR